MDTEKNNKTQWHRLLALALEPLFKKMGYDTSPEVDLSKKKQIIDLIVVKKSDESDLTNIPRIFWEVFDDFNTHNLITFKTYSESFNPGALEELWGHYSNYLKIHKLDRQQVNLYAITHHFPELILKPFEKTKFVKVVMQDEVYDLKMGNLRKLRIIVTHNSDNPILALFSGRKNKVFQAYEFLKTETDLLQKISIYFQKIMEYYGEEISEMYTKKDFFRDYPNKPGPFLFPWVKEYHEKELKRVQDEVRNAMHKKLKKVEAERKKAEAERKKVEAEQKKAILKERKKAEVEQKKAILKERKKAEAEQKKTEAVRKKVKKLSEKLKSLGVPPEEINSI